MSHLKFHYCHYTIQGCTFSMESIKEIFNQCQELIELNISALDGYCLSENCVDLMCDNLSTKIEKLDVTLQYNFGDKQLVKLLKRCKKLSEIALEGTPVSSEQKESIRRSLPHLKYVIYDFYIASPNQRSNSIFGGFGQDDRIWEIQGSKI